MSRNTPNLTRTERAIADRIQIVTSNLNRQDVLNTPSTGARFRFFIDLLYSFRNNLLVQDTPGLDYETGTSYPLAGTNFANMHRQLPVPFLISVVPLLRLVMGDGLFHEFFGWLSAFIDERTYIIPVYHNFLRIVRDADMGRTDSVLTAMRNTMRAFPFLASNSFWQNQMPNRPAHNVPARLNQQRPSQAYTNYHQMPSVDAPQNDANNNNNNNVSANEVVTRLIAQNTRLRQERNEARDLSRQLVDDDPDRTRNNNVPRSQMFTANEQRLVRENASLAQQVDIAKGVASRTK